MSSSSISTSATSISAALSARAAKKAALAATAGSATAWNLRVPARLKVTPSTVAVAV